MQFASNLEAALVNGILSYASVFQPKQLHHHHVLNQLIVLFGLNIHNVSVLLALLKFVLSINLEHFQIVNVQLMMNANLLIHHHQIKFGSIIQSVNMFAILIFQFVFMVQLEMRIAVVL